MKNLKLSEDRQACIRVMAELMTIFEEYKPAITFVGGWIPYFVLDYSQEIHIGSKDIDIAFDLQKMPENAKKSILQILEENHFIPAEPNQPTYSYYRKSLDAESNPVYVKIDFITGRADLAPENLVDLQQIKAFNAPGCSMAFNDSVHKEVSIILEDGSEKKVMLNFANIVPFLVMKGQAITSIDRDTRKDAYDIFFTINNYPGGVESLSEVLSKHLDDNLVRNSLENIREKFNDADTYATQAVVNQYRIRNPRNREEFKQTVFEKINDLFHVLEDKYSFQMEVKDDHRLTPDNNGPTGPQFSI